MRLNDNKGKKLDARLNNYSQVYSLNRLSNQDSETVGGITAGGDKTYLEKDIDDDPEKEKLYLYK